MSSPEKVFRDAFGAFNIGQYDDAERLFKKFERGDAARAGGLGLGLSIVRGFIVAQGGDIVVGENPGGGAVFTIYLPHAAPQAAPAE